MSSSVSGAKPRSTYSWYSADEVTSLVRIFRIRILDDLVGVEEAVVLELLLEHLLGRTAKPPFLIAGAAFLRRMG